MPEIVAQNHRREVRSLEAILVSERERLLAFLRRLGAAEDAEDILQDAWIRVRSLDRDEPEEARSYLYRMLHNLMLDRRKALRRRQRRDTEWAGEIEAADRRAPPDDERRVIAIDEIRAVHEAIDAIGEPASGIFRRHRLQGQTQRAIAEELGIGLSTVEKHLRRAYGALLAFRKANGDA